MQTLGQWPVHRCYIGQKELRLSLSGHRVRPHHHQPHGLAVLGEYIHVQTGKLTAGLNFILVFQSPVTPEAEVGSKIAKNKGPKNEIIRLYNVVSTSSLFQGRTFPSYPPTVLIVSHTCGRKSPVFGATTF